MGTFSSDLCKQQLFRDICTLRDDIDKYGHFSIIAELSEARVCGFIDALYCANIFSENEFDILHDFVRRLTNI